MTVVHTFALTTRIGLTKEAHEERIDFRHQLLLVVSCRVMSCRVMSSHVTLRSA